MAPSIFESNRVPRRVTPAEPFNANPDVQAVFRDADAAVLDDVRHTSLGEDDFTDSTQDLLLGSEVSEVEVGPEAATLLHAQEDRYTQLQTDIAGLKHQLDDQTLSVEQREQLTQSLAQLQKRAVQIEDFLRKARGYVGPMH